MKPVFPHLSRIRDRVLLFLKFLPLSLLASTLTAQDIHLSHIHASPVYLNPAMNGIFNGDLRFIANYKSQWNTFTNGYRSLMASADMKLNQGIGLRDDMAVGFQAIGDIAGDLDFSSMSGSFSFSYLKSLDKSGSHILAIGFNAGLGQNRLDLSKARTKEKIDPYLAHPDFQSSFTYLDISAGISWFVPLTVDNFIYIGAARFHMNRSRVSFLRKSLETPDSYYLYPRSTIHGGASIRLGNSITIKPSFIYLHQGPHEEINLGTFFSINHAERSYLKPEYNLHLGAWYRWSYRESDFNRDALVASVRYDKPNAIYTFSYDINISNLVQASRSQGGPELSIIHYIDFYRPERKKFRVKCPEF